MARLPSYFQPPRPGAFVGVNPSADGTCLAVATSAAFDAVELQRNPGHRLTSMEVLGEQSNALMFAHLVDKKGMSHDDANAYLREIMFSANNYYDGGVAGLWLRSKGVAFVLMSQDEQGGWVLSDRHSPDGQDPQVAIYVTGKPSKRCNDTGRHATLFLPESLYSSWATR